MIWLVLTSTPPPVLNVHYPMTLIWHKGMCLRVLSQYKLNVYQKKSEFYQPVLSLLVLNWGEGCLQHEQEGEKGVRMRSCTDLCWKLSGRPPLAMPPPALPPSVGSSDPPQCAGDSSGQHLNIWRQGERMRVDGAQEMYSATQSSCAALTTPHPNTLPPCMTATSCH